jgi:hypothetical protein
MLTGSNPICWVIVPSELRYVSPNSVFPTAVDVFESNPLDPTTLLNEAGGKGAGNGNPAGG